MQKYAGEYDLVFVFLLYNINNFSIDDMENYLVAYDNSLVFMSRDVQIPKGLLYLSETDNKIENMNVYRADGKIIKTTELNGDVKTFDYDTSGNLINTTAGSESDKAERSYKQTLFATVDYTYNNIRTDYTYDNANRTKIKHACSIK